MAIVGAGGSPVLAFAAEEIRATLADDYRVAAPGEGADWTIALVVDRSMAKYSFEVSTLAEHPPGRTRITLRGADEACVLHALYTMLDTAGVRYDVTGVTVPDHVRLDRLHGPARLIRPAVERRGIRLHLNFAMDISSYPFGEAKAYVRNLARLRMNTLTLHSYPGQWYPASLDGGPTLAGTFFYGQRHEIPDVPFIKATVRNARVFAIPEIEPFDDQPAERSRRAIAWLRAVMAEAKRVGLSLNFSLELRDTDTARSLATCDAVLDQYPLIDGFEIITQEDSPRPVDEIQDNARTLDLLRKRWQGRTRLEVLARHLQHDASRPASRLPAAPGGGPARRPADCASGPRRAHGGEESGGDSPERRGRRPHDRLQLGGV